MDGLLMTLSCLLFFLSLSLSLLYIHSAAIPVSWPVEQRHRGIVLPEEQKFTGDDVSIMTMSLSTCHPVCPLARSVSYHDGWHLRPMGQWEWFCPWYLSSYRMASQEANNHVRATGRLAGTLVTLQGEEQVCECTEVTLQRRHSTLCKGTTVT